MRPRLPRAEPERASPSFVVAVLGGHRIALPTTRVVEVTRLDGWVALPCDDPANLGVTFYRNQLVPLVDIAPRRDDGPSSGTVALCIIARVPGGVVAVPVEEVCGLEASRDETSPPGVDLFDFEPLDRIYGEAAAG
ncbi:MAG: chemotaxis protein CheW [Candidatus Rokuibacteriota bacterium]